PGPARPAAREASPIPPLARQLRWYIAIRVVAVGSVLLAGFLIQLAAGPTAADNLPPAFLYALAGLTFTATLLYIALFRLLRERYPLQAYIQFGGDLVLITALVYYAGGIASPFSMLYLIIIAVASTLLRRRAGIIVASAAYLLYASLLVSLYYHFIPVHGLAPAAEPDLLWRLNYNLAVHFVGFYAVALLTSYLSQHVTRAERELEEKSEDLADLQVVHRDVIESISSGLVTTDLDGVVTSVNRAGLAILGREEGELLGSPIQSSGFFSVERWGELTAASEQRGRLRAEVEVRRGTGMAYLGFSISQLTDAFETQRGYIVIFQDLTRWRLLQEEVRLKDRMAAVGELAAGLAHEIGNPLAAISGSVQMLSGSAASDGPQRKLIDILLKESQRLDRTIKGFLRFARPRERLNVRFDVARQLTENFELLRNSEEVSPRHLLAIDLQPDSAYLIADPDQVSQIFWNLTRNSLRAMPEGGTLQVIGRLGDDCYRVQFKDNGRGMSEEQRANLFHPFQSFFDGGTGIGMAIVYRIVQEHGGHLGVDSRPGGGTTITVELPTAEAWGNASNASNMTAIPAIPGEAP
ncbi:MAG: two-component system, NtrC family, sensor histidine kinase PilS, partial [Acidobacteriota bacterium]|nr:two-component system, NtrC family, sensor histidine kinase PilS [Acidobacteriota bacterium]